MPIWTKEIELHPKKSHLSIVDDHWQIRQMTMSSSRVPDVLSTYFLLDEKDRDFYVWNYLQNTPPPPYIGAEKGWKLLRALKNLEGIMKGKES